MNTRLMNLWSKMEEARSKAGRSYTTTDDLTPSELIEFRRLQRLEEIEQQNWEDRALTSYRQSQLSGFMPHDNVHFD